MKSPHRQSVWIPAHVSHHTVAFPTEIPRRFILLAFFLKTRALVLHPPKAFVAQDAKRRQMVKQDSKAVGQVFAAREGRHNKENETGLTEADDL